MDIPNLDDASEKHTKFMETGVFKKYKSDD